jgi:hypothetical protein
MPQDDFALIYSGNIVQVDLLKFILEGSGIKSSSGTSIWHRDALCRSWGHKGARRRERCGQGTQDC